MTDLFNHRHDPATDDEIAGERRHLAQVTERGTAANIVPRRKHD
ncbi:MAG: hypothetical protein OEY41_04335 [Acidimicrobiia bacterium]|nr:hypothetical protein [Acidimicrobiia bacterium]